MKILTLEGNNVVDTFDGKIEPGRFVFIFCTNGVFYLDTTIGTMWTLKHDEQICKEHLEVVNQNRESNGIR